MTYVRILCGLFACAFVSICEGPKPVPPQPSPTPDPSGYEISLPIENDRPAADPASGEITTEV